MSKSAAQLLYPPVLFVDWSYLSGPLYGDDPGGGGVEVVAGAGPNPLAPLLPPPPRNRPAGGEADVAHSALRFVPATVPYKL